jgi:DNA polymerase delta subunit 3
MDQYKHYLATNVLNERQIITYRSLSRALKVNVNLAKKSALALDDVDEDANRKFRMLFEFHKTQNEKQNKSVHATYVVTGLKAQEIGAKPTDGEDTIMNSSPFPSSYIASSGKQETPAVAVKTISLVKEEELEGSAPSLLCCVQIQCLT